MESLLVTNNLYGDRLSSAMVPTMKHLSKGTFSKGVYDLVAISKVITVDDKVISTLIVIPIVIL